MTVRRLSIQRRLGMIMMITTSAVLLLAGSASIIADFVTLGEIAKRDLNTLGSVIALDSAAPITFRDHETAREVLSSLRAKPSIMAAALFDRGGAPFATWAPRGDFAPASLRSLQQTPLAGAIHVYADVIVDGEKIGTLYIAGSRDIVMGRIRQYVFIFLVILIVALGIAFILSSSLPRVVSRPIEELAAVAREVTRGDNYNLRAPPVDDCAPREVADLVTAFNLMLTEVQVHREDLELQVQSRTAELSLVLERKHAILESAAEGIFGLDLDGVVTFMNASAARILGSDEMSLVGRPLHAYIHSATCPDRALPHGGCRVCGAGLDPAVRTGRGKFNRFDDAGAVPIEYTSCTIVDERGNAAGVVVTFRDISEQLAVERMKDEFVSTVSHELRTPLTSIRGALGLLGSGLLGDVDARAQRMLDIAIINTDRLVRLINDILDLERMESGRVELSRGVVGVSDLMIEAVEGIQPLAERAGVTVIANPSDARVWGDRDRILQTLTNLLSNAVKFSRSGTIVMLNGSAAAGMYTFAVEDEGRGIPKDHLESVFERFKQVDASDARLKGGTGLGLAICRSIIVAHGGRIWAESEEQKGTTFYFTIPLHKETRHAA
jgi:PAS domain S-box-containing protein